MTYETQLKTLDLGKVQLKYTAFRDFEAEVSKAIDSQTQDDDAPLFGDLWPSAVQLCKYMMNLKLKGSTVLELGCGLGIPSILAAIKGANVTATDYHPDSRDFVLENAKLNNASLDFHLVDWRKPAHINTQDFIIGSDILYEPEIYQALVKFITEVSHENTQVIIADPERVFSHRFFDLMDKSGFSRLKTHAENQIVINSWRM